MCGRVLIKKNECHLLGEPCNRVVTEKREVWYYKVLCNFGLSNPAVYRCSSTHISLHFVLVIATR